MTFGGDNAAAVPVPNSVTVNGVADALFETDKVALRLLIDFGVKVVLIVQLLLPARPLPHVFVCEKSVGLLPPKVIEEIAIKPGAVLVRVTGWETLLVPRAWVANVRLVGEMKRGALSKTETR